MSDVTKYNAMKVKIDILEQQLAAKDAALKIYANPDNWKSHDGYMYLATMGHPWADAASVLPKGGDE